MLTGEFETDPGTWPRKSTILFKVHYSLLLGYW